MKISTNASKQMKASSLKSYVKNGDTLSSLSDPPSTGSGAIYDRRLLAMLTGASKYHRAAIDGYVDMLCDATKRDANMESSEWALTPTLLAALSGNLEALRILVGRGGDPEKTAASGSSALHLAVAGNHLNCVSFLVNFGVNMWALDNELHTAKDIAAIEQRKEILDYLDRVMAKQSALNTKNVQKLKEKAKVAAERRMKQVRKAQMKAIKQVEKDERHLVKLSHSRRLLRAAQSISDIKLVGRPAPASSISSCSSAVATCNDSASEIGSRLMGSSLSGTVTTRLSSTPSLSNLMAAPCSFNSSQMRVLETPGGPQLVSNPKTGGRQHVMPPRSRSNLVDKALSASAYSSSVSTNFTTDESSSTGYSSSSVSSASMSAGHLIKNQKLKLNQQNNSKPVVRPVKPEYSDLVALECQKACAKSSSISSSSSTASSSSSSASSFSFEASAVQDNSKAIGLSQGQKDPRARKLSGGVSQKLQLRRLLMSGNGSTGCSNLVVKNNGDPKGRTLGESLASDTDEVSSRVTGSTESRLQPKRMQELYARLAGHQHLAPSKVLPFTTGEREKQLHQHQKSKEPHYLLTQCLSQLKLRHEAASSGKVPSPPPPPQPVASLPTVSNQGRSTEADNAKQLDSSESFNIFKQKISAGRANLRPLQENRQEVSRDLTNGCTCQVGKQQASGCDCKQRNWLSPRQKQHSYQQRLSAAVRSSDNVLRDETIEAFLASNGLGGENLAEVFAREKIDFEALMLLSEEDLKSLDILLGPRRKLLKALESRRKTEEDVVRYLPKRDEQHQTIHQSYAMTVDTNL